MEYGVGDCLFHVIWRGELPHKSSGTMPAGSMLIADKLIHHARYLRLPKIIDGEVGLTTVGGRMDWVDEEPTSSQKGFKRP